jgi:hypothetical protein
MVKISNERSNDVGRTAVEDQFEHGDRVRRTETGQLGVVRRQLPDGYVSLNYDDGRPAQLDAASLERIQDR